MGRQPTQAAGWNQRYSGESYLFGTGPNRFLASQVERLKPGMLALAIADGEGRNGVWLAEHGLNVLSLDFSEVALEKAKRLAAGRGAKIRTLLADIKTWNWSGGPFDLILAIFIQFADPALRAEIFARTKENLAPGCLLMLEGYRPEQLTYKTGGPPIAENMYTAALLHESFSDLEILHLKEYDASIEEGQGHSGMSALVDLVARKPLA
jgi:cyclopropane fatty-acyl-phospholipid synthase-like methyltransferase